MSVFNINEIRNLKGFTICMALSLALAIFAPQEAFAQGTLNDFACGTANSVVGNGEDHLRLETADTCNTMNLIDDLDYQLVHPPWENTTWFSADGTRRDAFLRGFDLDNPNVPPTWTITVRTLTFDHIDMQHKVPGFEPQRFEFAGSSIGLTLINGSVNFATKPLWTSASPLTISAPSGTNTIRELGGNQGPPTTIEVADGSSLQIADGGCLGPANQCPSDATRLQFVTSPNAADIAGTLDIFRSHVIFPTGGEEMLVRDTGELLISGSSNTVLETGTVTFDGGSLTLGGGENFLEAETLNFDDATVTFGDNAEVLTDFALFTGTNTMFLGNGGGFKTNFESTGGVVLLGGTLTLTGAEEFRTPLLEMLAGPTLEITEFADLVITPLNTLSFWESGSVDIATNAVLAIQNGGALGSSIPINNEGNIRVEGVFLPEGTMTGTGDLNVVSGGRLGSLGGDADDTFTTSAAVTMDDNSTFAIFLNPTQGAAQKLVADGGFSLGSDAGVFLQIDVFDDVLLPPNTVFPIVDYPVGNAIGGYFKRPDSTPLMEGDLITLGPNQYIISYADPNFGFSAITLTANFAEPIPALDRSSLMLLALLMLGVGFIGMRRIA